LIAPLSAVAKTGARLNKGGLRVVWAERDKEKKMKIIDILKGLAINAAMIALGYLASWAFAAVFPYTLVWMA